MIWFCQTAAQVKVIFKMNKKIEHILEMPDINYFLKKKKKN